MSIYVKPIVSDFNIAPSISQMQYIVTEINCTSGDSTCGGNTLGVECFTAPQSSLTQKIEATVLLKGGTCDNLEASGVKCPINFSLEGVVETISSIGCESDAITVENCGSDGCIVVYTCNLVPSSVFQCNVSNSYSANVDCGQGVSEDCTD